MSEPLAPGLRKLIMIVDDDEGVREILKFFAAKEGYRVKTAADGESALSGISGERPDLILLDLMLPLRSGFDVMRKLRSGRAKKIPIIVITGHCAARTTADAVRREPSVVDFLEKPINLPVLAGLMHRVLDQRPWNS